MSTIWLVEMCYGRNTSQADLEMAVCELSRSRSVRAPRCPLPAAHPVSLCLFKSCVRLSQAPAAASPKLVSSIHPTQCPSPSSWLFVCITDRELWWQMGDDTSKLTVPATLLQAVCSSWSESTWLEMSEVKCCEPTLSRVTLNIIVLWSST